MLLFLAKQSLLHHSLVNIWTFSFLLLFLSAIRSRLFLYIFIDFWSFRWSIWHSDFWRRSQIVDLNSVIWILKDRGFELLYRSSSCRFSAEWDAGEVFLLLFFNANKCFNLIDNSFLVFRLSTLKIVIHAGIRGLLITDVYSLLLLVSLIFLTKCTTAERNSCCNL